MNQKSVFRADHDLFTHTLTVQSHAFYQQSNSINP